MSKPCRPYTLSPFNAQTKIIGDGLVTCEPRRSKVAITGAAKSMSSLPWNDPAWEIWGLNNFWNSMRDTEGRLRADRWFEIHPPSPPIQNEHDMSWLRSCPVPIYTTEPFPENRNAVVFPVQRIGDKYRNYFSCTFAYQIALAIDEGFKEIAVHGLELAFGTQRECTVERACVNYWLGLAEGKGMKVTIPQDDFVLSHWARYGFDYHEEAEVVKTYASTLKDRVVAI
jgi:hypothetical protein